MFCFLEVTRIKAIEHSTTLQTEVAVMNTFSKYHNVLWKEYKSLGRNVSDLESNIIKEASISNTKDGISFFDVSLSEVHDFQYTLFTDNQGALFIKSVSNYMKEHFLYENVQSLYSAYEAIHGLLETKDFDITKIDTALEMIEQADSLNESETEKETTTNVQKEPIVKENLLEEIKKLQKKGILQLVLKNPNVVSEKKADIRQSVSKRKLKTGTFPIISKIDGMDMMLFHQYLFQYFGNYQNQKNNTVLAYELEYLIGKKESDTANLKATVNKILLTRQAVNMLYLLNDAKKLATAHTVALSSMAVGVPPAMVNVVKLGIITAWAYAESILDVRALLAGKKIPVMKSDNLWTLEVDDIANVGKEFLMAKESKNGISYEQYLRMLLFFESEKDMAFRTMDIMEMNIQKSDAGFYLDEIATGVSLELTYMYSHLFLSFSFLPVIFAEKPNVTKTTQFFYALE